MATRIRATRLQYCIECNMELPTIPDKALKWPEIEDVLERLNRSTSPYPECWEVGASDVGALLATIFLLVDPTLHGIAVSREYLRTVHALLGFNVN